MPPSWFRKSAVNKVSSKIHNIFLPDLNSTTVRIFSVSLPPIFVGVHFSLFPISIQIYTHVFSDLKFLRTWQKTIMNNFFPRSWTGHAAESCVTLKHLEMEEMYVAKKYNCSSVFANFQEEVRSFPEVFKWQALFIHKVILWALAICFGICFAVMSWLHPAGLLREATPDNLSSHMWCSPPYMH